LKFKSCQEKTFSKSNTIFLFKPNGGFETLKEKLSITGFDLILKNETWLNPVSFIYQATSNNGKQSQINLFIDFSKKSITKTIKSWEKIQNEPNLKKAIKLHSKEAGVNNKRFLDELVNATYGWQVQGDLKEGIDRGVKDVPTFFVNGTRIAGNPSYEELSKAIDVALKNVKNKGSEKKQVKTVKVPAKPTSEIAVKAKTKTVETKKAVVKADSKKLTKVSKKVDVKVTKVLNKPVKKAAPKVAAKKK
jgi:hypothetical protein